MEERMLNWHNMRYICKNKLYTCDLIILVLAAMGACGGAVVGALRYKPGGRGINS
jgi:hypothetical protein